MTTTEIHRTDATATHWKLDAPRSQLDATAEEYAAVGPPLDGLVAPLDLTIEFIAEVQAKLAVAIVKTAGPATR